MRRIASLVGMVFLVLAAGASGRSAGNFGFGPPPSYPTAMEWVTTHLQINLKDPESVKGLAISQPIADCHSRGHPGRRDVCGYRMCVAFNAKNGFGGYVGRQVRVFWMYQGFGAYSYDNAGLCSSNFAAWKGDPPVEVREFCKYQPDQEDCKAGKKEYFQSLTVQESVGEPLFPESADGKVTICSDEFKDALRAKGMTYADIDDVCKAAK